MSNKPETSTPNSEGSSHIESNFKSIFEERKTNHEMLEETNEINLTQVQGGTIEKLNNALRIPDIIRDLTEFSGDLKLLHRFLSEVDDIIIITKSVLPKDIEIPVTYIKAIRNKIKGEANEVLIANDVSSVDWTEMKHTLINHYSDSRSEVALIRDLHRTRQGNQTSKQFHQKIIEIQTALIARCNLQGDQQEKRKLFQEMCLAQFISNLREPIGSNIRSRSPNSINKALELCIEEENMYYMKYNPPLQKFSKLKFKAENTGVSFKNENQNQGKLDTFKATPKKYIPKEEWAANKGKTTPIKLERNLNFKESNCSQEEDKDEYDDEITEEHFEEFFRDSASEEDDG